MEYQLDCSLALDVRKTLDPFTLAYIETAMWTLTDDDGSSLDYLGLHDIDPSAIERMKADCASFQADHWDMIESDLSQAGHDFWLTRNRHGAGFWDGDWPKPADRVLTDAAHAWGSADLYVGDDNTVYHM